VKTDSSDAVALLYDELPKEAKVEIVTEGGWGVESSQPAAPSTTPQRAAKASAPPAELPESLKKSYAVLTTLDRLLAQEPNAEDERAFVRESLAAIDAWRMRSSIDPGSGFSAQ